MNKLDDIELYEKFENGEIEAFEILYNRYSKEIKLYIKSLVKNEEEAEEIVQDTFLIVFKSPDKFDKKGSFKNFIFKVAKYRAYTKFNTNSNRAKIIEENGKFIYDEEPSENILNTIEREEDKTELEEALDMLKPEYKEAINLVDFQEMSYKDAANKMNKTEDQFRVTLHRARKSLEDKIEKFFPEIESKYRRVKKIQILLITILAATMITGLVYASIMIYKYVTKKDETYTLEEVYSTVDESLAKIKREDAKTIIGNYLDILEIKNYDLDKIELKKNGKEDIITWKIVDEKYQIDIDASTGELFSFNNYTKYKDMNFVKDDEIDVVELTTKLYKNLNIEGDFILDNKESFIIDKSETDMDKEFSIDYITYSTKYDEKLNKCKFIIIEYIPETRIVKDIRVYTYKFDDTDIKISKEDAINLIKKKYNNIEIYEINLEISMLNWNKDTENTLRNINKEEYNNLKLYSNYENAILVWNVKVDDNNIKKIISVNAKTGELIDEVMNFEEKTR